MSEPKEQSPHSDSNEASSPLRVQILSMEHTSLLMTRSITWNEAFSRAGMLMTLTSASLVALALVSQVTGFGASFRLFALLVLPLVLLIGITTYIRLAEINSEDFNLLMAMNRIRHAYIELAPELRAYFTTRYHDDVISVMESYGINHRITVIGVLAGTPTLVGAFNLVLFGVIAALICQSLGFSDTLTVICAVAGALLAAVAQWLITRNTIRTAMKSHQPRFPAQPSSGQIGFEL